VNQQAQWPLRRRCGRVCCWPNLANPLRTSFAVDIRLKLSARVTAVGLMAVGATRANEEVLHDRDIQHKRRWLQNKHSAKLPL